MAVAFNNFGEFDGVGNSTTPVSVVPSPAINVVYRVDCVNVYNNATGSITGTLQLVSGSNTRNLQSFTIAPGQSWSFGELGNRLTLTATNQSLQIVLTAIPSTQPDLYATWALF